MKDQFQEKDKYQIKKNKQNLPNYLLVSPLIPDSDFEHFSVSSAKSRLWQKSSVWKIPHMQETSWKYFVTTLALENNISFNRQTCITSNKRVKRSSNEPSSKRSDFIYFKVRPDFIFQRMRRQISTYSQRNIFILKIKYKRNN